MTFYQTLLDQTEARREAFLAIPLIRRAVSDGVTRDLYLDFLGQAFHHVRHTAPLLALAYARCSDADAAYREALCEYLAEERGHEAWILDDIRALGGDADGVRQSTPRLPCKVMVAYAYHLIDRASPYAMLGMVHVLEGMSVALASAAAAAIRTSVGQSGGAGFSYLSSHGALDEDHVAFFRRLVDALDARHHKTIVDAAKDFYQLYGAIFTDIQARAEAQRHAA